MRPEIIGLLGIVVLLVLLAARMWIGAAMILVGLLGTIWARSLSQGLTQVAATPFEMIAFYPMTVMPMFVIMGYIISETGIGSELYFTAQKWLGQIRGGLAIATAGACAMLGAITAGSMNAIIIMGKVALPEMQKYRYDDRLSTGVIAASATMGILIPPSMGFILYGILTENSVGKLFMAGIIPGILEAVFYMITIYIMCRINPKMGAAGPKTNFREKIASLRHTWAMLVLFLLVIGGIYGGIFTPTEAGAVGALGAVIIATASRRLTLKKFWAALRESGLMMGMMLLMIAGVFVFQHFMAASQFPIWLGELVTIMGISPTVVIVAVVVMYIIAGCFIPEVVAVVLTIPVVYPVIQAVGFDPIWFGVIVVRMMEIGSITPPMAINIFMLSGVSGISIGTISRGVVPFIIADFCHVALLIAVPQLSLFLPNMMD